LKSKRIDTRSATYLAYLAKLAFPPMVLLWSAKPVWVVLLYGVAGAWPASRFVNSKAGRNESGKLWLI
jgi:hypothetical protein